MSTTESGSNSALKGSSKYLPLEKLPRLDASTIFREAYSQLNRSGCSGFFLSDKGKLRGYVKANVLANVVVAQSNEDQQRLREFSAEPIGDLIARFGVTLVPVTPAPSGATEAQLHAEAETVFEVRASDGSTGWYLNHETVRDAATRKTVFICKHGHRNPDSDHGTCYSCPFPIIKTDTE